MLCPGKSDDDAKGRAAAGLEEQDFTGYLFAYLTGNGQTYDNQENLKRVWAPQTIYDPDAGNYLVYWSMKHGNANDIIYYNPVVPGYYATPDILYCRQDDKYYLYWGNGYMAVAELGDDMVSNKRDTLKVITPPRTFREGTTVFFRQGKYCFLWSENDTRSEDYRVRYAVSSSPTGPLEIPEEYLVIAKLPEKGIYGIGHNSVIQVPGKDEWYIVYHRFSYPNGIKMGRPAGYHREVCTDRLEFDEQGRILRSIPTHHGVGRQP